MECRVVLRFLWLLIFFGKTTGISIHSPGQYCRVLDSARTCVCKGIILPNHDTVSFELDTDYPVKCSSIVLKDSNLKYLPTNLVQIGESAHALTAINSHIKAIRQTDFTASECVFVNLKSNDIDGLEASVFSNMPLLHILFLADNKISFLHKNCFEGLSRLKTLHLQHNNIKELDPAVFQPLTQLRALRLGYNKIKVIRDDTFMHNPNIQELWLDNNNIKIVDVNILKCPKALKFLTSFIDHTTTSSEFLKRLPNLQLLNMTANLFAYIDQETFASNQRLKWVDLTMANISCVAHGAFQNNKDLTHLYLGGNDIEDIDMRYFEVLRNLEYLNLRHNNLLELKNYHLFQISPNFKGLFLESNSFNCSHLWDVFEYFKDIRLLDVHPNRIDVDCFDLSYSNRCTDADEHLDDPCQEIVYKLD